MPSGRPRLVHVVRRADGQIARELSVCQACHDFLAAGTTATSLLPGPKPLAEPSATPVKTKPKLVPTAMSPTSTRPKLVHTGDQ